MLKKPSLESPCEVRSRRIRTKMSFVVIWRGFKALSQGWGFKYFEGWQTNAVTATGLSTIRRMWMWKTWIIRCYWLLEDLGRRMTRTSSFYKRNWINKPEFISRRVKLSLATVSWHGSRLESIKARRHSLRNRDRGVAGTDNFRG